MTEQELEKILDDLRNNKITSLDLSGQYLISTEKIKQIVEALKKNESLTSLDLGNNQSIHCEGAQAIAEALKQNKSLTSLDLRLGGIGSEGAQAIAEALKQNSSLTSLDLGNNQSIRYEGAQAIAEALKHNKSLTSLDLRLCGIGNAGAQALAKALKQNQSLTSLNLMYNFIGHPGAQEFDRGAEARTFATSLAEAIRQNKSLTSLNLRNNQIEDAGAQALAKALKQNKSLTSFDFRDNHINNKGALAEALIQNSSLTSLDLENYNIGDVEAQALAKALEQNQSLASINFAHNKIGDLGAQAFAEALKHNKSLVNLNFYGNKIGAAGAQGLAKSLEQNKSLTSLNLMGNQIGTAGAQAFAKTLEKNKSLVSLDFYDNQIGDVGAQALAKALKNNKSLTSLDLRSNQIDDEGTQALAKALENNKSLASLNLGLNQISDTGAQALAKALERNQSLTSIVFWGNQISPELESRINTLITRNLQIRDDFFALTREATEQTNPALILSTIEEIPMAHQIYALVKIIEKAGRLSKKGRDVANHLAMIDFLLSCDVLVEQSILKAARESENPEIFALVKSKSKLQSPEPRPIKSEPASSSASPTPPKLSSPLPTYPKPQPTSSRSASSPRQPTSSRPVSSGPQPTSLRKPVSPTTSKLTSPLPTYPKPQPTSSRPVASTPQTTSVRKPVSPTTSKLTSPLPTSSTSKSTSPQPNSSRPAYPTPPKLTSQLPTSSTSKSTSPQPNSSRPALPQTTQPISLPPTQPVPQIAIPSKPTIDEAPQPSPKLSRDDRKFVSALRFQANQSSGVVFGDQIENLYLLGEREEDERRQVVADRAAIEADQKKVQLYEEFQMQFNSILRAIQQANITDADNKVFVGENYKQQILTILKPFTQFSNIASSALMAVEAIYEKYRGDKFKEKCSKISNLQGDGGKDVHLLSEGLARRIILDEDLMAKINEMVEIQNQIKSGEQGLGKKLLSKTEPTSMQQRIAKNKLSSISNQILQISILLLEVIFESEKYNQRQAVDVNLAEELYNNLRKKLGLEQEMQRPLIAGSKVSTTMTKQPDQTSPIPNQPTSSSASSTSQPSASISKPSIDPEEMIKLLLAIQKENALLKQRQDEHAQETAQQMDAMRQENSSLKAQVAQLTEQKPSQNSDTEASQSSGGKVLLRKTSLLPDQLDEPLNDPLNLAKEFHTIKQRLGVLEERVEEQSEQPGRKPKLARANSLERQALFGKADAGNIL